MSGRASFVFAVPGDLSGLARMLRDVFVDPWVATYQVGFGPPLVRATPQLEAALVEARGSLDKLSIYVRHCLEDEAERSRLVGLVRRLVARAGPVEVEAINRASEEVWDLQLRLHRPSEAPEAVRAEMERAGVTPLEIPPSTPPELLGGRFRLHLHDPTGARLIAHPAVAAALGDGEGVALELRVDAGQYWVWQRWLVHLEQRQPSLRIIDLGEPLSHARVHRDGSAR